MTRQCLSALCRQQYKHGVGCAEAGRLTDAASELDELARVLRASRFSRQDGLALRLRKTIRLPLTLRAPRALLLAFARAIEGLGADSDFFSPVYRFVIGLHFTAGVRDGWMSASHPRPNLRRRSENRTQRMRNARHYRRFARVRFLLRLATAAIIGLMPGVVKRPLYRLIFGYRFGRGVRIGLSLSTPRHASLGGGTRSRLRAWLRAWILRDGVATRGSAA